ncbi:chemotaxis protein CheW [Teichococcus vastitatis]
MQTNMQGAGTPTRGGTVLMGDSAAQMYLTLTVAGQLCGVPVLAVRDIMAAPSITRVPLAPREVAGSLNLRGRIVTAIDLRRRLGLPLREAGAPPPMSVVVEQGSRRGGAAAVRGLRQQSADPGHRVAGGFARGAPAGWAVADRARRRPHPDH